jgi:hypothetical protein
MWKSLTVMLLVILKVVLMAQDAAPVAPGSMDPNHKCLKCHGGKYFSYFNETVDRDVKERMNPYYIVDSAAFSKSNHRSLSCTDCHSSDYASSFPHTNQLRFEPMLGCLDCHEGDDNFAQYHFETIEKEFLASVHSEKHSDQFTCWMCHNPHSYHISARTSENLAETIRYDNQICLGCHGDQSRFGLLSNKDLYNMLDRHEWLPNHLAHFKSVRCIECHAEVNSNILVAHKILPREKAVKKCVECHSKNSILLASLYKYQAKEKREKQGFLNGAILTETYVIGANRNRFLNVASLGIVGLVFIGIFIHALMRKIHSNK